MCLLLVFGRVMVPDAAWLALHPHEHTEHEAAHAPDSALKGKTLVAEKHTHCATDHLFDAPTLPAPMFAWGVVVPLTFTRPVGMSLSSVWTARLVQTLCLRGPPAPAHAGRRTA